MQQLPLFFNLNQQPVLLVGGGAVALRKARLLKNAGARLTVVALQLSDALQSLLGAEDTALIGPYRPDSLRGQMLVVAATDNHALHRQIYQDAKVAQVPINVVDTPALCSFTFPAIVDRSPLVIGISSGGQAPVLVRQLRARLETLLPHSYGQLARLAGCFRDKVKDRFSTLAQRRRFWEENLAGEVAEQVFAGRMVQAEKLLDAQLASQSATPVKGQVALVGAGPGDPELLTFKALRLMQQADIVFYDNLVSPSVLDLCRRDADLVYVGKKRNRHTMAQQDINVLLAEHARRGRRVVRLKGGDPFIFGRGGEELESLKEQGIDFQVVPGITAASGCAAYAGIPLTHRDYAHSVQFVTGQLKSRRQQLDFRQLVQPGQTLVFYMGLYTLPELVKGLTAQGKPETTPVAIVSRGSSPQQQVLAGTLANITALQQQACLPGPGLIIVGEVVSLHNKLSWFGATCQPGPEPDSGVVVPLPAMAPAADKVFSSVVSG